MEETLLGVALVVQLPSQQPEVIFQYPPKDAGRPEALGAPALAGGGDAAAAAAAARRRRGILQSGVSGSKPFSPSASLEDLGRLEDCFDIPAMIFAKLMLPDEELCNRALYLEIDGGRRETTHSHQGHSHLLFVSFPCNISEFTRQGAEHEHGLLDPRERVQRFNIVHILDSRRTSRRERVTSTLWQVSAHVARALVCEELRVGYLSKEVKRMSSSIPDTLDFDCLDTRSVTAQADALTLDHFLKEEFLGLQRSGYCSLRVNGSIMCQICVFPKDEAPVPPSPGQALALMCAREELKEDLPLDSADIVRRVIDAVAPTVSLGELMVHLALPMSTLQRVAQHLVYWKKARVVDVFKDTTCVTVTPGVNAALDSSASLRFRDWWRRQHRAQKYVELTLPEILSAFAVGHKIERVRRELCARLATPEPQFEVQFCRILEWLIAEGLLLQLATYCHFLPASAISQRCQSAGITVRQEIVDNYCPPLSSEEVELLALCSSDFQEHLFLCRFVEEFARAHRRIDGDRFAALAAETLSKTSSAVKQAYRLIEDNPDIFVTYVCPC